MSTSEASSLRVELRSAFGGILDDTFMEECTCLSASDMATGSQCILGISICQNYHLSAKDLSYKWEAITIGTSSRVFDENTIPALKQHIQREIANQEKKKISAKPTGTMSRNLSARALPSKPLKSSANAMSSGSITTRADIATHGSIKIKLEMSGTQRERRCMYC